MGTAPIHWTSKQVKARRRSADKAFEVNNPDEAQAKTSGETITNTLLQP